MNIVDEKQESVIEQAKSLGLGLKIAQTNGVSFIATTRMYLYPINEKIGNVNSKNVIAKWKFGQNKNAGTTKNCIRYHILASIEKYLNDYSRKTK